MLSIIICSRAENISDSLANNIKESVGCAYELVVINNSKNLYSIFQAYNMGLERSKGDFICFLHDDINILTPQWGTIIKEIFSTFPKAGLLGVAGGKIKTRMPSTWWDGGSNALKIVQHYKSKPKELWDQGFNSSDIVEVANIDGVFMVMKRDEKIKFDERLSGFHNYDLNLSTLNHMAGKKVLVTNRILVEHFSEGNQDKSWYKSASVFHKLYKNHLPIVKDDFFEIRQLKSLEFSLAHRFVTKLIEYKLYEEAQYWWFQLLLLKPFSKLHYRFFKVFILQHLRMGVLYKNQKEDGK